MASTVPVGGKRDVIPSRIYSSASSAIPGASSIQVLGGDIDRPAFYPTAGGVHTVAVAAAGRTFTITDAAVPLPYDLKIGEGFSFIVQNNGASTITLARAGNVVAGSGTLTVATNTSRMFFLCRTSQTAHQLTTFGTLTH